MNDVKKALLEVVEANADRLFEIACDIFDHPEYCREEYYACDRLTKFLEGEGFTVERGVGGLETAFRATWEQGSGGPAIGFMMEYDALKNLGHGCGHHLQGPATIGGALALKAVVKEPFKLVLYGTPDEENKGGKIDMVEAGLFRDVDVMFSHHTARTTGCSFSNKALAPQQVTFHGKPAHASGAPWNGRSAMDAMLLAFHGLEVLREHVKDGCRVHYTIMQGTGPSNIVHETARAHITLRAEDKVYLEEMRQRMENILKGACLMTDTTYEVDWRPVYWNYIPNQTLRQRAFAIAKELGSPALNTADTKGTGSSDIGNVSWVAPSMNLYTFYDFGGHTVENVANGKTAEARFSMVDGSRIFSQIAYDCITDKAFLEAVKAEFRAAVAHAN